jgi:hypothetical protein
MAYSVAAFRSSLAVSLLAVALVTACGKDGPTGPAGPQGPAGPSQTPPSPNLSGIWTRADTFGVGHTYSNGGFTDVSTNTRIESGTYVIKFIGGSSFSVVGTTFYTDSLTSSGGGQPPIVRRASYAITSILTINSDSLYGVAAVPLPSTSYTATTVDAVFTDLTRPPCLYYDLQGPSYSNPYCRLAYHWRRVGP